MIDAIINFFKSLFGMSKTSKTKPAAPKNVTAKEAGRPGKRTIYALMVAIDRYNAPVPPLRGCVNDRNALKEYLERRFANNKDVTLNIKTLTDEEAKKDSVIEAFNHFANAKKDDICLFYFSGHGSQSPAPREFIHLDPDGMNESLVCFDSRHGARDLMDKELSYLIWKATDKKDVHFVSIFDCCHSGTITRDATITPRMAPAATFPTRFQEYYGHQDYKVTVQNNFQLASPPRGRYIQLAACKDQETAKETQINGKQRGLFTYNLIEMLEQNGGSFSYQNLIHTLQVRIANQVRDQMPQLEATNANDKDLLFLGGAMPATEPYFLIQFLKGKWQMNGGLIQGIPAEGGEVSLEDGRKVRLTNVKANISEVDGMGNRDTTQPYKAFVKGLAFKKMKIGFAHDANPDGKRVLTRTFQKTPSPIIEISNEIDDVSYIVHVSDNTYRLTLPGDERPVFRRVPGYTEASALAFISHTEKVANWRNLLTLSNPKTSIKDSDISIELYRVTDAGNYEDDAPAEKVDWRKSPVFGYEMDKNGEWQQPAFRMKVRNNSTRTLYFSTLNLMDNFAISNKFMPLQELAPGREAWLLDTFENKTYQTIPLSIDDTYHSWGITEAKEYFKLIISTDSYLNTQRYNQDGLELDVRPETLTTKRAGRQSGSTPDEADWITREIELVVVRPMEKQALAAGQAVPIHGAVKVTAPRGMSATAALSAVSEAERSLSSADSAMQFAPMSTRSADMSTEMMAFTAGNHNSPGLSVLELYDLEGADAVSSETPLDVNLQHSVATNELIIPMGYDPETGMYLPLGFADADGHVHISSLPPMSPSRTRSLGGSVKIFFQKVIFSKLGFEYKHPQLAMARFAEVGEDFTYETNMKTIQEEVAKAKNIVLFIHGIIGDTSEMPRMLRRMQRNGAPLQAPFDLALTFDYENLNTKIEDNARLLKQRLEEAGLSGQKLTIIAHSMGGLVSRWFIEKEGGNAFVKQLIQVGTPNMGSPWSDVHQLATALLTRVVNGAAFLQPYLFSISLLGQFVNKLFVTLQQMDPNDSPFLKALNNGTDPGIPYTIVAGNTQLAPPVMVEMQQHIMRRALQRFQRPGTYYVILDSFLFKIPNDIAVAVDSIYGIPGSDKWKTPPRQITVGCDHISYFGDPEGLKGLAEAIG